MTYQQLLTRFGTQQAIANALGIDQSTVSCWNGEVPAKYQYQLAVLTANEPRPLRVDRRLLRFGVRAA